jgi:hypothetical protein
MRNQVRAGLGLIAAALAGCADAAAPGVMVPAANEAETPILAAVTGSGHIFQPAIGGGFVRRRLTFTARQLDDGTIEGSWQLVAGAAIIRGSVTCFELVDGAVRVGGVVESALFTTFVVGTDTGWYLEDNGEGSTGDEDVAGRLIFNGAPGTAEAYCAGEYTDSRVETVLDIYGGNVQLHE